MHETGKPEWCGGVETPKWGAEGYLMLAGAAEREDGQQRDKPGPEVGGWNVFKGLKTHQRVWLEKRLEK